MQTKKRPNDYQYNGKELEKGLGLKWSFYGARMMDPAVGRFTGVDPLAGKYAAWSPYNYTLNNPISVIDPDGLDPEWFPRVAQGKIRLIAEPGDNLLSLKSYFEGSSRFSDAQLEDAYNNAIGGVIVTLPEDNYSRALTYAAENSDEFARPDMSNVWDVSDNYNCYHHSLNGATGGEIYDSKLPFMNDIAYFGLY